MWWVSIMTNTFKSDKKSILWLDCNHPVHIEGQDCILSQELCLAAGSESGNCNDQLKLKSGGRQFGDEMAVSQNDLEPRLFLFFCFGFWAWGFHAQGSLLFRMVADTQPPEPQHRISQELRPRASALIFLCSQTGAEEGLAEQGRRVCAMDRGASALRTCQSSRHAAEPWARWGNSDTLSKHPKNVNWNGSLFRGSV